MATMSGLDPELRAFLTMYKWQRIEQVPWAEVKESIERSRVGVVVTACMTAPDQPPFDAYQPENDASMRVYPPHTLPSTLVNTYPEQSFDHAALQQDANVLVPLDRLREMVDNGEIGELGPRVVSLCGHLPKPQRLIAETAPEIARMFLEDEVDCALIVPA